MNQQNSEIRGLVWKEARQLFPLVAILFGVGLFLIVLWQMIAGSATTALDFAGRFVPLILPSLYAVGAAAVLVGQEKEQRTLWWLASLPAPPRRLIFVKFTVALVGLAAMWFGCALLTWIAVFNGNMPASYRLPFAESNNGIDYAFLLFHSLFILLCGFYTAWRLQNAFVSLVAIVPLAIVPIVMIQILDHLLAAVTGRRLPISGESQLMAVGITVVATAIVAWLGYRAATRVLQPADPDPSPDGRSRSWRDAWRPTTGQQSLGESYRFPISSLLWQSIHHNRWVLAGLAALIGIGVCLATVNLPARWRGVPDTVLLSVLSGVLGVAWLGVFAFTGDGSASRLRFLADRGVSPTTAWLGRHLIGLSILATAVLLYAVLSVWRLTADDSSETAAFPSVALIAMLAWGVYSISQWTGQLIRLMAASAMAAPLLSTAVLYWLGFSAIELETPFWLLVVCATLPMLTTWLMMRRFMDDNGGLQFWMPSLVTLGLIIILPAIPLAVTVAQFPEMPGDVRARLSVEARQVWQQSRSPLELSLHDLLGVDEPPETEQRSETLLSGTEALQLYEKRRLAVEDQNVRGAHLPWVSDGAAEPVPISVEPYALSQLLITATEDRLRFQLSPADDRAIAALADRITLLTQVARGLRQSRQWIDQDHADFIEIWLTQTLSSESFRPLLQRGFARQAISLISDQQARNHARRRAVLAFWHSIHSVGEEDVAHDQWGWYWMHGWWPDAASSVQRRWLREQRLDAVVDAALRLIEAGSGGMPTEPIRRELHRLGMGSSPPFVTGPYSDRLRIGSAARGVLPFDIIRIHSRLFAPASQWCAPWEQDAVQLAKQFPGSSEAATGETP